MSEPVDYGPCRCTTRPVRNGWGHWRVPGMFCRIPGHNMEEWQWGSAQLVSLMEFKIPPAPPPDPDE